MSEDDDNQARESTCEQTSTCACVNCPIGCGRTIEETCECEGVESTVPTEAEVNQTVTASGCTRFTVAGQESEATCCRDAEDK